MILSILFCISYMMGNAVSEKTYNGYEHPVWKLAAVQPEDKSYEVREYSAANWTSTGVQGKAFKDARKAAFWRLFSYIQGLNSAGLTMSMTVPVTTRISTGATLFDTKRTMSFYIPQQFQTEPPTPTNIDVYIEKRPSMTAYVRTFSGYADEADWWENIYMLHADMLRNGVNTANVGLKSFFSAGYDSPFHLINRRNEVWLIAPLNPTTQNHA